MSHHLWPYLYNIYKRPKLTYMKIGWISRIPAGYFMSHSLWNMVYDAFRWLIFRLTIGVEWSNVAELVDTDILSEAITFIQLETSIGVFVSPLLGGTISDRTGDYSYVFYIAGILLLSGEPLEARDPRTASVQSTFCGSKMDAVVVDQIFESGFRDGPWTALL